MWQVAAKNNQLDKVQDELAQVSAPPCSHCSTTGTLHSLPRAVPNTHVTSTQMVEAFQTQPELARVAVDPFLPVRSKVNIMNSILKDSQATDITKRLFGEQLQRDSIQQRAGPAWTGLLAGPQPASLLVP